MSTWSYCLWLFRQAADGLRFLWPITAALVGMLAVAVIRARQRPSTRIRGGWSLQLAPLVVPIAILAVGAAYACEQCSPSSLGQGVRHVWPGYFVDALLFAHVIAVVWLIRLANGWRFVSSSLQAIGLWCTFWASFLAGMSISGDWL